MEANTRTVPIKAVHDDPLAELMDRNFLDYASYVICERAIPNLSDGLKPVQRRIMHSLDEMDDGRFIKVANVVGNTMQYHPHGDASIGAALVNLANRGFLIEKQGNFGNVFTGDPAAAPRYIECRLTEMAREILYNKSITEYVPSYDGRNMEPVEFPSRLPLLLAMGAEGVAVGMATRILPHNLGELLDAQTAILNGEDIRLLPDFPQGGLMDPAEYDDGMGTVRVRAKIEHGEDDFLYIREIPFGTNTDSLVASIEEAIRARKLPVVSINNYTAEEVDIELVLQPETNKETLIKKLYAFTNCEVVLNSCILVLRDRRPVSMKAHELLKENTNHLMLVLEKELLSRKKDILNDLHARTLQRIFIEEKVYQILEHCSSEESIRCEVRRRMELHRSEIDRDITDDDIGKLLSIRIRQISGYDMDKALRAIKRLEDELEKVEWRLANLKTHALRTLRSLKKKYCPETVRKTVITSFSQLKRRDLTADEIVISFDSSTGYIGSKIKGERSIECSPYDKVVLIWKDGRCRVHRPFEKIFADLDLVYFARADAKRVMTVVYNWDGFTYLKRFKFSGAVADRLYRCIPKGARITFATDEEPEKLYVKYKSYKGIQISQQYFEPKDVPVKKVHGDGKQMTSKDIEAISTEIPDWWDHEAKVQRGLFMDGF